MTSVAPALLLSAGDRARIAEVGRLVALGPQSVSELLKELDAPSWVVRRAVARALANLGDAAIPAMCALLVSGRQLEARIAGLVEALVGSTGKPEAALLALIASSEPPVICDAAQILGRRHAEAALATLSALVDHADDNVSLAAIEALGRIGGQPAVEPLIRVLDGGAFFRVFPAIEVVGRLGDVRATASLIKLSAQGLYALEAARALGRIADVRAIPTLVGLLLDPADAVVRTAAVGLWEIHEQRLAGVADPSLRAPARWMPAHADGSTRRLIEACAGATRVEQEAMCQVLVWFATGETITALVGFLKVDGDIAHAAKAALARLGDAIGSELLSALRTGDSARRLLLLPLVGSSPARTEIEACLTDPAAEVRAAACTALGRLGNPSSVPVLFERLGDAGAQVAQAAVNAILSLGSEQTERLALAAAGSENPRQRRAAVRIIATLGYEAGLGVLLAAIEDPDERVRDIALPGLALLEAPAALDGLLEAGVHSLPRTRSAALRALGLARADPRIDTLLLASLGHPNAWVRYQACHALGARKSQGSIEALVRCLADPAGQVRIAAVEALSHMPGDVAPQALRTAATDADSDLRRAALVGLGLRGEPDVLPTLLEAAHSDEPPTRLVAVSALAGFKQPEAFAALADAANDADEGVRTAAMGILSVVPGAAATRALIGLISGRHSRSPALLALCSPLEGRVTELLGALDGADSAMAGPLAATLGRLKAPGAEDGLLRQLGSKNIATRRAVAAVLRVAPSPLARVALAEVASTDSDPEVRRLAADTLET